MNKADITFRVKYNSQRMIVKITYKDYTMENYFNFSIIIGIILFVLSWVVNIIACNLLFMLHKDAKKIEVKSKTQVVIFACLSDIIAFLVAFLILIACFHSDFIGSFNINTILYFCLGAILSPTVPIKIIGVLIGMLCIFLFDYFIAFKNWVDVSQKHKLWLSVAFALTNAPYFFLVNIESIVHSLSY